MYYSGGVTLKCTVFLVFVFFLIYKCNEEQVHHVINHLSVNKTVHFHYTILSVPIQDIIFIVCSQSATSMPGRGGLESDKEILSFRGDPNIIYD